MRRDIVFLLLTVSATIVHESLQGPSDYPSLDELKAGTYKIL